MVALAKTQPNTYLPIDEVVHGDCLDVLRSFPANSLDACVVDPPYGLGEVKDIAGLLTAWVQDEDDSPYIGKAGFMGKAWDAGVPGPRYWREVYRVLKPGAHILCFAGTRTVDLMTIALRLAGFECRDMLMWIHGQGFPKSLAIDKAVDKIKDRSLLSRLADEIKRARAESRLSLKDVEKRMLEATNGQYGTWYHRGGHMFFETGMSLPSRPEWEYFKTILPINPEFYGVYDEAEREVLATRHDKGNRPISIIQGGKDYDITAPATPEAQQWSGWGTNLKPSHEPIILARKPISEKTIAANVLKWGTGGLNIDATRISHNEPLKTTERTAPRYSGNTMNNGVRGGIQSTVASASPQGRFPSHLLLSHSIFCVQHGVKRVRGGGGPPSQGKPRQTNVYGAYENSAGNGASYRDADLMEEVEDWECVEDCPIRILNEQSGIRKSGGKSYEDGHQISFAHTYREGTANLSSYHREASEGGASRYFTNFSPDAEDFVPFHYFSKSSRRERNAGCEGLPENMTLRYGEKGQGPLPQQTPHIAKPEHNSHPTVKSLSLMSWLCRLITPPDGIALDPFAGSGSTLVACIHEGFHFIGIEQDLSYVRIAEARVAHALREVIK